MGLQYCRQINFIIRTWLVALIVATPVLAQQETVTPAAGDQQSAAAEAAPARMSTAALLPDTTRFWVSVGDTHQLETNLSNTQIGKLSRQDTLAPFFASFEEQMHEMFNNNGIKFGIDVADVEGMETGEVAFASILPDFVPGEKPEPHSHGIVVLIDVSKDIESAKVFLDGAAKKMKARGAIQENLNLFGTKVSKWTIQVKAGKIARKQSSFLTIVDGWLLASDNESIFSNVLRRVLAKEQAATNSLSKLVPFVTVRDRTRVKGIQADLEWFVDPIGYARFADAIAEDNRDVRQPKDRPLEALAKEGLDAIEAAGGFLSFSTGEHDALYRTLVYANKKEAVVAAQKRIYELLDFAPDGWTVTKSPNWVPTDAAGYFTLTWDIDKAFQNVAPLVDAISGQEGTFNKVLDEMKRVPNFEVDIRKMVQSFGKRITVVVKTEEPINESSEKMLVGIELNKGVDEEWLIQSIGRAVKGKIKKLAGYTYVIDDRTVTAQSDDIPDDEFGPLEIEIEDDEEDGDGDAELKEAPQRITIFNRRFMLIRDGVLFICNDKEYLKKIVSQTPTGEFEKAPDFVRVGAALDKLADSKNVRVRMFNRLDLMLKTNYEMLRTGRMADSETVIARMLNQLYGKKPGAKKRTQQIDGSDLPADFEKEIAPSLGQSGMVMETTDVGWRFSGCLLPKIAEPKAPVDKKSAVAAPAP